MVRLFVVLFIALCLSVPSFACPQGEPTNCKPEVVEVSSDAVRNAEKFQREVEQGRLRDRTHAAFNAMIRFAAFKLRAKGKKQEAQKLLNEWDSRWSGYFLRGIGDHKPFSEWIAQKYAMIELILGVDICHALRLDDIKIVNFSIPVVFACVDDVDVDEYGLHFVPFAGTIVYWTSFFACVGGTWGTGFLWCSPISWGAEFVTEKWIAPALNEPAWKLFCQ